MKKLVSLVAIALLALTGCGSSTVELDTEQPVTLTVMGWGFGEEGTEDGDKNINRVVANKYMEENPNVTIELVQPAPGEDYNELVTNMAAGGNLPDVFLYAGSQDPVANQWAMDITEYTEQVDAYDTIHQSLREGGMVGDAVYGLPVAMNFGGIKVNETMFEELNITPLEWGFSMEDYMQAIRDLTTDTTKGTNIDGSIMDWYPATQDSSVEWFNFTGEGYDYSNQVFLDAYAYDQAIFDEKLSELTAEAGFFPEGSWPIGDGYIGTVYDFTWWNMSDVPSGDTWEFIGLPGGDVTVVPDYMYVSSTTENPEWAIDFISYYGAGSYELRYNDASANNQALPIPLTDDAAFVELYNTGYAGHDGMIQALDAVINQDKGIVEGFKVIPGYPNSRFSADTGIVDEATGETYTIENLIKASLRGDVEFADYADQLQELSNSEYEKAKAQLGLE